MERKQIGMAGCHLWECQRVSGSECSLEISPAGPGLGRGVMMNSSWPRVE